MRRILKVAVSAAAALLPLAAGAPGAAAHSGGQVLASSDCHRGLTGNHCQVQPIFAGYSAFPNGGYVAEVLGSWVVPKVSCPRLLTERPRAAVWVGMWAGVIGMQMSRGWLPQVGTASVCNFKGQPGPRYSIAWEMMSQVKGQGNAAQDDVNCPGDHMYSVCAYKGSFPNTKKIAHMKVMPGDRMDGAVDFFPPQDSGAKVRVFELRLTDESNGEFLIGHIRTSEPVWKANIAGQGGIIVEDEPRCFIFQTGSCFPGFHGLARFMKPIEITRMMVATCKSSNNCGTVTPLGYNEWVMRRGVFRKVVQLAQNSPRSGSAQINRKGLSFSVTWLRRT
jgi:hypothetical protein